MDPETWSGNENRFCAALAWPTSQAAEALFDLGQSSPQSMSRLFMTEPFLADSAPVWEEKVSFAIALGTGSGNEKRFCVALPRPTSHAAEDLCGPGQSCPQAISRRFMTVLFQRIPRRKGKK